MWVVLFFVFSDSRSAKSNWEKILKSLHFKNTAARSSVLTKLRSFSIIHVLTLFLFQTMKVSFLQKNYFTNYCTWECRRLTIMGSRKSTTWACTIYPNPHPELVWPILIIFVRNFSFKSDSNITVHIDPIRSFLHSYHMLTLISLYQNIGVVE